MGCAITKSPQSDPINSIQKNQVSLRRLSQCQTQSPLDSSHKYPPDQQLLNVASPPPSSGSESVAKLRSITPITLTPKKTDLLPVLKLSSNNPSLQDFSFKNSPEMSFDKEKEKNLIAMQSPGATPHIRIENNTSSKMPKGSTPSFARNLALRSGPASGNNIAEGKPKDVEIDLWSLVPPKDKQNNISPIHPGAIKEVKSEDRSSSGEKEEKSSKAETRVTKKSERKALISQKNLLREELPEKPSQGFPFKNFHRKLHNLLLSEDTPNETPPQSASKGNTPSGGNQIKGFADTMSPPKTLTLLDNPMIGEGKKSLELPDHTIISSPTNGFSVGTISNLVNMCKDIKKKDFDKKFRTNLVDLIKDKPAEDVSKPEIDLQGVIASAKSVQNGRTLSNTRKFTSKIFSPKSTFSQNLLNFNKEEENRASVTPKNDSIHLQNEDVFGDLNAPSPVHRFHSQVSGKHHMPPLPWLAHFHSVPKLNDTSVLQDKTTYNLEEGISRVDFEKYSILEQVKHVDIDERSLNQTQLESSIALENPTHNQFNMSGTGTELEIKPGELNMLKSKSVPHAGYAKSNEIVELLPTKSNPPNPANKAHHMNESVSTLQFLSPKVVSTSHISARGKKLTKYTKEDSQVIETNRVDVSVDDGGQKKINQYILIKELGRGGFGKVKLALNVDSKTQHAIKIANKKKLKRKLLTRQKSAYTQLASEIAILKKLDHPNIVKLFEVIDDPNNDKLYLIMDFFKRGAVMSRNYYRQATKTKEPEKKEEDSPVLRKRVCLSEEKSRKFFRHLILGLDYLHNYAEIIHRDIKPENLLIGEDDVLRISDFGISKIVEEGDDRLENSAGTQYYLPPEAFDGKSFHGKPTDIWAAGGTLYYFLVGKPPFQGMDLQRKIREDEPNFPEELELNPKAIELIKGCLRKDPNARLTLEQIMQDPWLTDDGKDPLQNQEYEKPEVTEEELHRALTRVKFMAAVRVMAKLKKNLNNNRKRRNTKPELTKDVLQLASQTKGI